MRDWLQSNPWFYILLVCVILLIISMVCFCYCKTCGPWLARRNRRGYVSLNSAQYHQATEDVSLRQKWLQESENQKNCDQDSKDAMELMVHFYLRSDSLYYVRTRFIKSLGHRADIHWFQLESLCRDGRQVLLKVFPQRPQGNSLWPPGGWNVTTAKTLADVLCSIQHPCVQPLLQMDFIINHNCVVLLEPLCQKGSLKDVLYKSKPLRSYTEKYGSQRGFALTLNVVRSVSLQLIRALQYLTDVLELPPGRFGCLHVGNAMLAANENRFSHSSSSNNESSWSWKHERAPCVLLSGWQSPMLGLPPYLKRVLSRRLLNRYPAALDTLCVGHLVFELACGRPLQKGKPQAQDFLDLPEKSRLPVKELLEQIFCEDDAPPSLNEVTELPFFQNVQLPHLQQWQPQSLQISAKQRALLQRIGLQMNGTQPRSSKKGRDKSNTTVLVEQVDANNGNKKSKKINSIHQDFVQSAPSIITSNIAASQPPVSSQSANALSNIPIAPPPPPPPPPPPAPTSQFTSESLTDTGRQALLTDICRGKALRKVSKI